MLQFISGIIAIAIDDVIGCALIAECNKCGLLQFNQTLVDELMALLSHLQFVVSKQRNV